MSKSPRWPLGDFEGSSNSCYTINVAGDCYSTGRRPSDDEIPDILRFVVSAGMGGCPSYKYDLLQGRLDQIFKELHEKLCAELASAKNPIAAASGRLHELAKVAKAGRIKLFHRDPEVRALVLEYVKVASEFDRAGTRTRDSLLGPRRIGDRVKKIR